MSKSNKSYIYEIRLPRELVYELSKSASNCGEEYNSHVAHVLREGLKRLAVIKERTRDLEETEGKLRRPI